MEQLMRDKFGLVIHWIGFALGIFLTLGTIFSLNSFATMPILISFSAVSFLIPYGITWTIRRAITGYASFFPWTKKQKED
jgi:hypothetical protein